MRRQIPLGRPSVSGGMHCTGRLYRLKQSECERNRTMEAIEASGWEHAGTQKKLTQCAKRAEWGGGWLKHARKLQWAPFLDSIEEQWSVDSEKWTENKQGSGILTTVH